MEVNEIKKLLANIENIVGPCFYDCELNNINDVLELHMDEYPDVGIEIDIETLKISIFVPFSYHFTKSGNRSNRGGGNVVKYPGGMKDEPQYIVTLTEEERKMLRELIAKG